MDNFVFDEKGHDELLDDEGPEDAFMKGYAEDERHMECEECGSAVEDESKVIKDIEGEKHVFCSKLCAQEYAESL
ncbi:hypothetical protein HYS49_03330 [Candidatus Woesearchaeota archaeon]|nr:hypothetical protein [Candidatus Woesearchaeota archaeon]